MRCWPQRLRQATARRSSAHVSSLDHQASIQSWRGPCSSTASPTCRARAIDPQARSIRKCDLSCTCRSIAVRKRAATRGQVLPYQIADLRAQRPQCVQHLQRCSFTFASRSPYRADTLNWRQSRRTVILGRAWWTASGSMARGIPTIARSSRCAAPEVQKWSRRCYPGRSAASCLLATAP